MAKINVGKTTRIVRKPVEVEENVINLSLTEDEAKVLFVVTRLISGDKHKTSRKHTDSIMRELSKIMTCKDSGRNVNHDEIEFTGHLPQDEVTIKSGV